MEIEYKAAERDEILASIAAAGLSVEVFELDRFVDGLNLCLFDEQVVDDLFDDGEITAQTEEVMQAIRDMDAAIARLQACRESGALHFASPRFEKAFVHLEPVARMCASELAAHQEFERQHYGQRRKAANNTRRLPGSVMAATARFWLDAQGRIDHGKGYKRFFEAVIRPITENRDIRLKYKFAWTDGMFRTHVSDFKSAKNQTDSRSVLTTSTHHFKTE
jgi:hypothetical protein